MDAAGQEREAARGRAPEKYVNDTTLGPFAAQHAFDPGSLGAGKRGDVMPMGAPMQQPLRELCGLRMPCC